MADEDTDLDDAEMALASLKRAASVPAVSLAPAARLALIVLGDALGERATRRLARSPRPVLTCLDVPDADWFEPLRAAAGSLSRTMLVKTYDAAARRPTTSGSSAGDVLHDMSKGYSIVCVSQDLSATLPHAIAAAADVRARLDEPTAAQVARAIAHLRSDTGSFDHVGDDTRGLGLAGIAACLRKGEPGRTTVRRLRRAVAAKGAAAVDLSAPTLAELHGYGAVADWGRRVADDVARHRAGGVAWHDVSDPAVLHGPPGTGKTLFARALARSCGPVGVPLVATSVGTWMQAGTGDLGGTVRAASAAFLQARAAAKEHGAAVLFIDELDSLPNRSALDADRGSWWRPVVNYVLTLVDGAASDVGGVVLLAATNDLAAVDPALLRPGRFGTLLRLDPPSTGDLARIVAFHLGRHGATVPQGELDDALLPTEGATQAAAASWASQALRRASDEGRPVDVRDVVEAALPADDRHPVELRRAAIHEAGHAIAASHLIPERLVSASIRGVGLVGGVTTLRARAVRMLTRAEVEIDVVVLLAGRAADREVGQGANSGAGATGPDAAASDLGRATGMLADLHGAYGLGRTLGTSPNLAGRGPVPLGGELAQVVEGDLQRLMRVAEALIGERAPAVMAVADALLRHRFLTAGDVAGIVGAVELGRP